MSLIKKIATVCVGLGIIAGISEGGLYGMAALSFRNIEKTKSKQAAIEFAKEQLDQTGRRDAAKVIFWGYRKACFGYLEKNNIYLE